MELHELSLPAASARGTRHRARRRHHVQPGAAPDRRGARLLGGGLVAQRARAGDARSTRRGRPKGGAIAFLEFGTAPRPRWSMAGYDFFDSDEWHVWIAERGAPKAAGPARRGTPCARDAGRTRRPGCASSVSPMARPTGRRRRHQPHFGVMIVTCARGEMRGLRRRPVDLWPDGKREIALPPSASMPGRGEVLDDHDRRHPHRPAAACRTAAGPRRTSKSRSHSCNRHASGAKIMLKHQVGACSLPSDPNSLYSRVRDGAILPMN